MIDDVGVSIFFMQWKMCARLIRIFSSISSLSKQQKQVVFAANSADKTLGSGCFVMHTKHTQFLIFSKCLKTKNALLLP